MATRPRLTEWLRLGSTLAQIKTTASDVVGVIRSPIGGLLLVVLVVAWGLVLWIYLPSLGLLRAPKWSEVMNYSPRFSDVFNASLGGGGLWSSLYDPWRVGAHFSDERSLGFTPVLAVTFLIIGLLQIRSVIIGQDTRGSGGPIGTAGLIAVWFTVLTSTAFFVMDDRGLSAYRLFWYHLPGLESVRAPFRIQVFLYALALFFVLRSCEQRLQRPVDGSSPRWRKVTVATGVGLLLLVVTVEMQRPVQAEWTAPQLISGALLAQIEPARHLCDAVIVADENQNDSPFINPIDAVIFSALSGLPTPQGYSRADPTGHPGPRADARALGTWMRQQGAQGRLCKITSHAVTVIP